MTEYFLFGDSGYVDCPQYCCHFDPRDSCKGCEKRVGWISKDGYIIGVVCGEEFYDGYLCFKEKIGEK